MTNFWGSDVWGTYLVIGVLLGSLLIYLAVNRNARDFLERKLFF